MPIRTPRGRSAAYRSIWQWPLRSPARLAAVVLAVLVVGTGVSYGFAAFSGEGAGDGAPTTTPTASAPTSPGGRSTAGSGPTPTALPPVAELTPGTLPPAAAPIASLQVASQWANAWVNHPRGTTSEQWVNRLRPYTTDEYLVVLGGVDPANVPANRVIGPAKAVRHSKKSVEVEVRTDALTLVVLVIEGETGWKVAGHDRAAP